LLDGEVLIDQFSEKRINSDDVWNLIDRTETRHEKAYDQLPVDRWRRLGQVPVSRGSPRVVFRQPQSGLWFATPATSAVVHGCMH
ncbi:MAG: hypothetical protein WBE69_02100, partial [Candidatus Binataceae bacterium]